MSSTYLPNNKGLLTVSDEGDLEHFELYPLRPDFGTLDTNAKAKIYHGDFGRPYGFVPSPCGKWIAYSNHRNELCILNLESEELIRIDQNKFGMIRSYDWSPDSRWLAYSINDTRLTTRIMIYGLEDKQCHVITKPVKFDDEPCFDPDGKYLYLLSSREYEPVMDSLQFGFSFIKDCKPYLITLKKDTRSLSSRM